MQSGYFVHSCDSSYRAFAMGQSDVLQPSSRLDFAPGLCSGRRRQQLKLHILSHPRSRVKRSMLRNWSDYQNFQFGCVGECA